MTDLTTAPADARVRVWGVPLAPWTLARAVDEIDHLVRAERPAYFMTVNLHTAMLVAEHPGVRAASAGAAFALADGMPLVWAARLAGRRLPERVTGADLFPALCRLAADRGYRVFFVGGPPGTGDAAARNLEARFPGLRVVGVESPPYRDPTPAEEAELLARVRAARPQFVFAAFGQPKGELWVHRHHAATGAVCAQVGAALDFAAGRVSRAPRWMQRTGLEWVYRLALEPRRLAGRYARNALFAVRAQAAVVAGRDR